jgi:hypothetical protein
MNATDAPGREKVVTVKAYNCFYLAGKPPTSTLIKPIMKSLPNCLWMSKEYCEMVSGCGCNSAT